MEPRGNGTKATFSKNMDKATIRIILNIPIVNQLRNPYSNMSTTKVIKLAGIKPIKAMDCW